MARFALALEVLVDDTPKQGADAAIFRADSLDEFRVLVRVDEEGHGDSLFRSHT